MFSEDAVKQFCWCSGFTSPHARVCVYGMYYHCFHTHTHTFIPGLFSFCSAASTAQIRSKASGRRRVMDINDIFRTDQEEAETVTTSQTDSRISLVFFSFFFCLDLSVWWIKGSIHPKHWLSVGVLIWSERLGWFPPSVKASKYNPQSPSNI